MTESADLERIGLHHIDVELKARDRFGSPYRNRELESKRRSAVLWLMHKSSRGWWLVKREGK